MYLSRNAAIGYTILFAVCALASWGSAWMIGAGFPTSTPGYLNMVTSSISIGIVLSGLSVVSFFIARRTLG